MPRWWLAVGPADQWRVAFEEGNTWGLKPAGRPALMWEVLSEEDKVLFYITSPVAGVVGYGTIRRKFKQDKPLWPDEVKQQKILWPLRFEFDIDHLLPLERWREQRADIQDLRILARGGFQSVEAKTAMEAVDALTPLESTPSSKPQPSLHTQLIEQLVEAGQLQHFIAEKEYRMENERLDAVWRRVERSVPTFVFEVQIGGDLYHALGKLKHAYDLWNSRIFIVAQERDRRATEKLLSGTYHEIRAAVRFIEVEKFQEIYELKRKLRSLEKELGLL